MSGSLIKIDEVTVSDVASVSLGGADWDSSYDVYQVVASNLRPDSAKLLQMRVTKSGNADETSNYDSAYKQMYTGGSYVNESYSNQDKFNFPSSYEQTTAQGRGNGLIMYLFNFNNASEYSFFTLEQSFQHAAGSLGGNQGGGVHTVASASDGVQFYWDSTGEFEEGTFTLYGLKK